MALDTSAAANQERLLSAGCTRDPRKVQNISLLCIEKSSDQSIPVETSAKALRMEMDSNLRRHGHLWKPITICVCVCVPVSIQARASVCRRVWIVKRSGARAELGAVASPYPPRRDAAISMDIYSSPVSVT
jgi:hypothetical protein